MKSFLFSVIHPTLGRPDVAIRRCEEWYRKATRPAQVEYVFGVHAFDTASARERLDAFAATRGGQVVISTTPRRGSSSNWNGAAAAGSGVLLVQAQDDLAPPDNWDRLLLERLEAAIGGDWPRLPVFIAVSDGHRADRLCISSIMTRVYRDQRGFFLFPEYDGVYADDDSTAQAYDDADAGRVQLIEARDLVFEHQHFSVPGGMAFDATYALENRDEAYAAGKALFLARHPRWAREELCRTPPPVPVTRVARQAASTAPGGVDVPSTGSTATFPQRVAAADRLLRAGRSGEARQQLAEARAVAPNADAMARVDEILALL